MNLANLIRIDQVVGAHAAGILDDASGLVLALAEQRTAGILLSVAAPRGNFHKVERQFAGSAAKLRSPEVDHRLQSLRVGVVLAHIRLALIPEETANGVVAQGVEHAVIHDAGRVVLPPLAIPALALFLGNVYIGVF